MRRRWPFTRRWAWWCIRVIINSITPPVNGEPADFGTLARLGNEGVLIAMADSTRVESPGYTPSERVLNDTFDKLFANGVRTYHLATFASLLSRVQQVIDTAPSGMSERMTGVARINADQAMILVGDARPGPSRSPGCQLQMMATGLRETGGCLPRESRMPGGTRR